MKQTGESKIDDMLKKNYSQAPLANKVIVSAMAKRQYFRIGDPLPAELRSSVPPAYAVSTAPFSPVAALHLWNTWKRTF